MYFVHAVENRMDGMKCAIEKQSDYVIENVQTGSSEVVSGEKILHQMTLETECGLYENVYCPEGEKPYFIEKSLAPSDPAPESEPVLELDPAPESEPEQMPPRIKVDIFTGKWETDSPLPFAFSVVHIPSISWGSKGYILIAGYCLKIEIDSGTGLMDFSYSFDVMNGFFKVLMDKEMEFEHIWLKDICYGGCKLRFTLAFSYLYKEGTYKDCPGEESCSVELDTATGEFTLRNIAKKVKSPKASELAKRWIVMGK